MLNKVFSMISNVLNGDEETRLLRRMTREQARLGLEAEKSSSYRDMQRQYEALQRDKKDLAKPSAFR
jgi:hypothetical protein